jgi:hypothetical protein
VVAFFCIHKILVCAFVRARVCVGDTCPSV